MNDIIEYKREENNLNPLSGYMWSHPETGQAYYDNEGYNQEVLYDEELRKREEEKKRQNQKRKEKKGAAALLFFCFFL
jgi:nitrogen fixation-related uncharacterized protein